MTQQPKNIAVLFLKRFKFFLLLPFLLAAVGFLSWRWLTSPVSTSEEIPVNFVVQKGEDLSTISQRLKKEGLVRYATVFKLAVLARGLSRSIPSGSFEISPSLSSGEIINLLVKGPADVWVTFPEGWRREEFSQRLKSSLMNFDEEEFLNLTKELEGYLFPDTYLLSKQSTSSLVVNTLKNNFAQKYTADLQRAATKTNLNQKQVLILASIVEREAKDDQDRPIIAGIIIKRWQANWLLQVDATVQYAIGSSKDWWPTLTKADLQTNSLFNTHKHLGLPPGPICNPGLSSIKAVIYQQQSPYWFYLSGKDGQIHYATTIEEHNQNVAKYLR